MLRFTTARSLFAAAVLAAGGLGLSALTIGPAASIAKAQETRDGAFKIDPVHTCVMFKIKHLDVANFVGRFNDVSGSMLIDADDPARSFIDITIKTESVDSNHEGRDKHIRNNDFLAAPQFPVATFKTTSFKKSGGKLMATGDFTLRGVTKPLTAEITPTGEGDRGPRFGYRQGFETTFKFKRTDHDVNGYLQALSDEIEMYVTVEGVRQ